MAFCSALWSAAPSSRGTNAAPNAANCRCAEDIAQHHAAAGSNRFRRGNAKALEPAHGGKHAGAGKRFLEQVAFVVDPAQKLHPVGNTALGRDLLQFGAVRPVARYAQHPAFGLERGERADDVLHALWHLEPAEREDCLFLGPCRYVFVLMPFGTISQRTV